MNFASTIRVLLRNWLFIGLLTLLCGAGAYAISATREPLYTATASEFFAVSGGGSAAEAAQGANYIQDQMASFGELATSPAVLNPVIDDLGLTVTVKQLARNISITTPRNTVIMQINVTDPNPATAAAIANSVGSQLINVVDSVGAKLPNGKSLVAVQSIQTALPPTVQSSPNKRLDTGLGLLIGLLVASAIVLGRNRMDNRVRTPEALTEITDEPVLGTIRHSNGLRHRELVVVTDAQSRSAEDVRHLRSNIEQLALGRPSYALAVTSSIRGEGRSTIAANLAAALGEAGRSCVLVDADLRRPCVAEITGTNSDSGLLTAVQDAGSLGSTVQRAANGSFDVLTAGGQHANPSELLASPALATVVASLRQRYEFVLIDTPAVLAVADAKSLRSEVDGALMVVDAASVRGPQLSEALQTADAAGLSIVGVVLNEVAAHDLPSTTGYPATDSRRTRARDRKVEADSGSRPGATVRWDTARS